MCEISFKKLGKMDWKKNQRYKDASSLQLIYRLMLSQLCGH